MIIASILSVLSIFLVAGTITLASTTNQNSNTSEKTVSQTYCEVENHPMQDGSTYCKGTKSGYHNNQCDYYEEVKNDTNTKNKTSKNQATDNTVSEENENYRQNSNGCHGNGPMNGNGHRNGNHGRGHRRMNNYN